MAGNEIFLDFDIGSAKKYGWSDLSLVEWNPEVTPRITNADDAEGAGVPGFPVVLFHPGIQLSTNSESKPRELSYLSFTQHHLSSAQQRDKQKRRRSTFSALFLHTASLIERAAEGQAETTSVYLFYESDDRFDDPAFLAGGHIFPGKYLVDLEFVEDVELSDIKRWSTAVNSKASQSHSVSGLLPCAHSMTPTTSTFCMSLLWGGGGSNFCCVPLCRLLVLCNDAASCED